VGEAAFLAIDPEEFVRTLTPFLRSGDLQGLVSAVRARWTGEQVRSLIHCHDHETVKCALIALAWVGGRKCALEVLKQLGSEDQLVSELAEHALWTIWFRSSSDGANEQLAMGVRAMGDMRLEAAVVHFDAAVALDEGFAEAFNQRAITYYLTEDWARSLADCERAIALMPCHFAAWAGKGHCEVHLGRVDQAILSYQRALDIHPRLGCVRAAMEELSHRVRSN
jgi:tetratricopeptide (TPR) repeat protein